MGKGAEPPKDPYYDLKEDRFFLNADDLMALRDETPAGSSHGSAHGGAESPLPAAEFL